jgi:nucleotide-binding universal stress UspA family protein
MEALRPSRSVGGENKEIVMSGPIVVACDPVRPEGAPVEFALAVAHRRDARVVAVACVGVVDVAGRLAEPLELAAADETLARLREELGVDTRLLVDGSPAHAVHRLAADERAELIVVGRTHRGPVGRVVPGSTAEQLVHGSPCAVALVPGDWADRPLKAVAVGFVDTPEGRSALVTADGIARTAGAALRVVSVVHGTPSAETLNLRGEPLESTPARRARRRAEAEAALHTAVESLAPSGEPELHSDDAADVLTRVSEHVDLVVCGSRGYGPLLGVVLGSVSRRLLDHARCPVLVVPRGIEPPVRPAAPAPAAVTGSAPGR